MSKGPIRAGTGSTPAGAGRLRRGNRALGGIAAQGSQALASFTLQILAVRLLGLDGLGRFATMYALIVLATALVSGFVGDSLTVLDRHDRRIRAGLQTWWITLSVGAGAATAVGAGVVGFVDGVTAVMVGLAATVFVLEDTLRRLLMASLTFWRIVVVDLTGLAAAVTALVLLNGPAGLELVHFFAALAVGQTLAFATVLTLLPTRERRLVSFRGADLRSVAAYGSWRALQLAVKPALLAAVRLVAIALVSATAVGELEAARIYISPTLILVAGVSSVLFASYAARRTAPLSQLLRHGDKAAGALLVLVAAMTLAAVLGQPLLGPLLTGGDYALSTVGILGWATYAAAMASAAPYSALAAVRGRQSVVLAVRIVESVLALVFVVVLLAGGLTVFWAPPILAAGVAAGALVLRTMILARMPDAPPRAGGEAQVSAPTPSS